MGRDPFGISKEGEVHTISYIDFIFRVFPCASVANVFFTLHF